MKAEGRALLPVVPGARPRVLVVEARFYQHIADELLAGAKARLREAGADVEIITVPGALEIPAAIAMAIRAGREVGGFSPFDGYIALGTVIRGETTHYDVVAGQSNRALMDLSARHGIAIGNGILTVENEDQALARARAGDLDKGGGAAIACLTMIALQRRFGLAPIASREPSAQPVLDRALVERLQGVFNPARFEPEGR